MLVEFAVYLSLNRHALSGHAVEGGLIEANCSLWSVGVVWVHGDNSHWVGGVIAELVQPRSGTVRVLAKKPVVEKIEHCISNCNAELIA